MHAVPVSQTSASAATQGTAAQSASASEDSFDFWDFLDIINPLQHIPIVNVLYREITGDEIGPTAKLIGGGLYGLGLLGGGWVSAASSVLDFAVEGITGEDIASNVMDFVFGDDEAGTSADGATSEGRNIDVALSEDDAAAIAAVARPPTVVVRSEALSDSPPEALFAAPDGGEGTEATDAGGADGLAAKTGQVVSPEMNQALLLAAQSDDPAAALEQVMAQSDTDSSHRRMLAPGLAGFSLDHAQVQVEAGVTRNALTGHLEVAAQ